MKDKESFFINLFPDTHIGDDGAVIGNTVYSKDLFCENIHFKREWMSLEQIAYKSMLVNISDAIVMNAKPKYALIGIKIPSSFTPLQLEALADGFLKAAKEFGFQIIGGDTVAGETLDISITIISETAHPIYRTGIEQSDLVAFTGDIGSVKQDLEKLLRGEKISENSKFITPRLRAPFFYEAASYIHAALDISDGLSKDLSRLSRINGVGFAFNRNISQKQLCSGEEYEILFTFPPKNLDTLKAIAQKHQTPLTIFATATEGSYESVCPENHFQE
jgi:thiamine-monophosphate kinase